MVDFHGKRIFLAVLYGFGLLGGLPYLLLGSEAVRAHPWYPLLQSTGRAYLAFNLLLVVGLLIYAYQHAASPGVRGQIRIVVLGGVLSALLPAVLTILPDALQKSTIIPYTYAVPLLGLLPLTYGYAIFRHRLIKVEKHVNRGATYILMYAILGGFYLILYAILRQWLGDQSLVVNTVLVLSLASIFVPLHRWVQKIVDTLFYGGWYDYRSAVTQITQGLEQVMDLKDLAEQVAERLAQTLRLEDTCVFLRDLKGEFTVNAVAPHNRLINSQPMTFSVLPVSSLTFLLKMGGDVGRLSLRQALSEVYFTPEESQLLNTEQDHLWVPVIGHGLVQGFLALGPKFGGDIFSGEDLDILRLVSRQISPVLENINLLTRLREHAADLEQRVEERTAELHNAKERVEAILASVGDGVIVTDLERNILTVNVAYQEQAGFTAAELVNRKLDALLGEHNDPAALDEMRLSLAEGRSWRGELKNERKGGSLYDIQMTMAPVRDQSGHMVGFVGSLHDITHEKELARLKDRFVSDVSHELRTPTTNISLYLDLMEDAPLQKRQEYLNVLKDQSYVLRKLVEDILDLSRLAMGRSKKIEFAAVDLNQITEQVILAHRPLAEAAHLALTFEPCQNLPRVNGEPNQLGRVITNLVSNAVRYTFRGSVGLCTYANDTQVCLEIHDTGIGIDPEDLPHLFERFYRGRQVRQSRIHGTGLGLAIVKEIVDLHDGSIEIHSQPEKGSVIRIWLPIYQG
ncbi:MAG TPA: ATP-binding protein, partial [Anaerolineales bacterium]